MAGASTASACPMMRPTSWRDRAGGSGRARNIHWLTRPSIFSASPTIRSGDPPRPANCACSRIDATGFRISCASPVAICPNIASRSASARREDSAARERAKTPPTAAAAAQRMTSGIAASRSSEPIPPEDGSRTKATVPRSPTGKTTDSRPSPVRRTRPSASAPGTSNATFIPNTSPRSAASRGPVGKDDRSRNRAFVFARWTNARCESSRSLNETHAITTSDPTPTSAIETAASRMGSFCPP